MSGPESGRWDQERDERYQHLVELAPDAILIHDGERIVLANAAAVRLAGATTRDQLIGLRVASLLDPPFLKGVQDQLLGSGNLAELAPAVRDTFRRLDGSTVAVEVRATAFMDRGRPSAHLVVRDITERLALEQSAHQVEERLQQAQRMEAVGVLAGGVAHEVNNMMTVVIGGGKLLLPRLSGDRRSEMQEILRAAEHAASIIRQLLSFSRRAFYEPRDSDLAAVLHNLEPIVRRVLGESRSLVAVLNAAPRVWVDPSQLEQVIVNLALNARDAMPVGGTLTISVAKTDLPSGVVAVDGVAIPAGRYGVVLMHDTGVGIDPATQARMFEPFFTTKEVGQGTGLGLAAVYGIMKQNDGYITVRSALGQGATFTLYLHLLPEDGADRVREEPPPAGTDAAHAGASVLVVEDESAVRATAARCLRHGGFRVIEASDGAAALELVERQGPPDLVLTDLVMPGMGGAELARRLKERWPTLPILFISGYSVAELRRVGALGVDGITIRKPFTPDTLVASVMAALSNQRAKG